jgi:hypothetical protein
MDHGGHDFRALTRFGWCLLFVGALIMIASIRARAGSPGQFINEPPEKQAWFARQKNQIGDVCCDSSEAFSVADWQRTEHGWEINIGGKDIEIDAAHMVNGTNPYGVGIVWIYPRGAEPSAQTARCFLRGMEG